MQLSNYIVAAHNYANRGQELQLTFTLKIRMGEDVHFEQAMVAGDRQAGLSIIRNCWFSQEWNDVKNRKNTQWASALCVEIVRLFWAGRKAVVEQTNHYSVQPRGTEKHFKIHKTSKFEVDGLQQLKGLLGSVHVSQEQRTLSLQCAQG